MNNQVKDFSQAKIQKVQRSSWKMPSNIKTTFKVAELTPFYVQEVLPGDTFKHSTHFISRILTPIVPTMDNLNLDYYYFFVPNRTIWTEWVNLMGESKGAWYDAATYNVPRTTFSSAQVAHKLGDYLGIVPGYTQQASVLPQRAYYKIYNEWFRDQNLQDPLLEYKAGAQAAELTRYNSDLLKANKKHDYFTSCLPSPQKGPSVFIPFTSDIPVFAGPTSHSEGQAVVVGNAATGFPISNATLGANSTGTLAQGATSTPTATTLKFLNLYASPSIASPTINALRLAFQIQRIYEKDARGGSRYVEMIRSHFGVISPDATQQRAEFLGGGSEVVGIQQVNATATTSDASDNQSALGQPGASSYTQHTKSNYDHSFTEHGYVIGLIAARYRHTYTQGIPKHFLRSSRFDFYDPSLAHIGEQPVSRLEIYAIGAAPTTTFGFQEAWADYRYKPSIATSKMRPTAAIDYGRLWTYADFYTASPTLSASWIQEDAANVNRTLAATPLESLILLDCYHDVNVSRVMPLYSVPGLIDHF